MTGAAYDALAARLLQTGVIHDPWLDGQERFRAEPLLVSPAERDALYAAAEAVARAYDELCRIVAAQPLLLDTFFALTPVQKLMWEAAQPRWHGIARADVFHTAAGPAVCELNCDTPTGEPEAVLLNALVTAPPGAADPNAGLERRFCDMIEALVRARLHAPPSQLTVGIVYPTETSEDLPLIHLYRRWFEARGWRVVLGSPFNLGATPAREVTLFGQPCAVVLRHYKTDGLGERAPVWDDDDPYLDAAPLLAPLAALIDAEDAGRAVVVNPLGAVLPQNKRAMAFMWERQELFSSEAQEAIRRHVPRTLRLECAPLEELAAQRERWVLKSDYGAEGMEVLLGPQCTPEAWNSALVHAVPGRWVAQERFTPLPDAAGESVNLGVFLVAGQAAGLYARVQRGATDWLAKSAPVLVSAGAPDGT